MIGKGYRFVASVTVVADVVASAEVEPAALPAGPVVALHSAPPESDAVGQLEPAGLSDLAAVSDGPGLIAVQAGRATASVPAKSHGSRRRLSGLGRAGLAEPGHELRLDVAGQILALHWAAGGKGWFLTTLTGNDTDLDFIDQDGRSTLLRRLTGRSWDSIAGRETDCVPGPDAR